MLDLLYHLYERIVKYKLTHFSGGYNRTKENKYFSKTDESLWRKAIGPVKWQPVAYEIAKGYYG